MAQAQSKSQPPLKKVLADAGKKALGGGIAGALAMVVQVVALMWMRTTINFQHKYGMSTGEALAALYAQGGITRFYQGMGAALLQAPLSRFGDTAAYAGLTALLENVDMPASLKTLCASFAAALFRIFITPIDTFKTTLQVDGAAGMAILSDRIAKSGFSTLYSGALGSSVATLVGHYPWFLTYDFLNSRVPKYDGSIAKLSRSAILGFISALTSDVVSNSVRVVKTAKQVPSSARATAQHAAAQPIIISHSHSLSLALLARHLTDGQHRDVLYGHYQQDRRRRWRRGPLPPRPGHQDHQQRRAGDAVYDRVAVCAGVDREETEGEGEEGQVDRAPEGCFSHGCVGGRRMEGWRAERAREEGAHMAMAAE